MRKGLQGVRDRKGHDEWSFRMEVKLKMIGKMDNAIDHTHDSLNRVYDRNGLCPTIPACSGGDVQPKIIEDFYVNRVPRVYRSNKGIKVIEDAKTTRGSDGVSTIRVSYHKNRERNIRENIETAKGYEGGVEKRHSYRIRKLTTRECWRLMDFSDGDFEKAEKVASNTQLYKQAGNSICVCVLMAIFSQLNINGMKAWNEMTVEERQKLVNGC